MKFAGYIHPLIPAQGPRSNYAGFATVAKILSALYRDTGSECILITGSRFPHWISSEPSASARLDGIRVVQIDEPRLLRQLNDVGVTPSALEDLLNGPDCLAHPAVAMLAEEIARHCGDFTPDVLISFATPTDFLSAHWPQTLRLHTEAGAYSRNPFPFSVFFDHLGMYRNSVIGRFGVRLRSFETTGHMRALAERFRSHHAQAMSSADPFRSTDFRRRFQRLFLLPLQVSNCFSFDGQCRYRTQLDFLLDVLSTTPNDVGVLVTEYLECGQVVGSNDRDKDYFRRAFPNMIFLDQFRSYYSPSQFLVPRVDGVWSVSSSVGHQALLFGRPLGTPGSTHLAGIADATNFQDFLGCLGPRGREAAAIAARSAFLAWQLERYLVPAALLADGAWLYDYFARGRDAAHRSNDPLDAFVPIADTARLEEAWIAAAPNPVAAPYLDPVQHMLRSTSWRVTAPLRAVATALRACRRALADRSERVMRKCGLSAPPSSRPQRRSRRTERGPAASASALVQPPGGYRA